ncbi:MAG: TolC family protein, partial [Chlamydiota bacterium]|nr:TolC family protein [Chlamydiota bacterium]
QKAQELLTIQEGNVKLSLEQLDIAQKRYDAGEVLKTDLLRAEVDESRAKRSLKAAQNDLSQIQVHLSQLIGLDSSTCQAQDNPSHNADLLSPFRDFDELLDTTYEKRNDLKALSIQKEIATWDLRRIVAGYFPSANLEFDQSWIEPESFAQRNNFWTFALKFEMPIFEGNRKKIELQRAHNRIEQIRLRQERLKKDIHIALSDAWYKYNTAQANLQAYQKEHELAQEHYEVTKKQYESGQATSLDLTDAFTNLVSARINYSNQRYDCEFLILKLLYTAGIFAETHIVNMETPHETAKADL